MEFSLASAQLCLCKHFSFRSCSQANPQLHLYCLSLDDIPPLHLSLIPYVVPILAFELLVSKTLH